MDDMRNSLQRIQDQFEREADTASTSQELENLRVKYLGKKGEMTSVLRVMGQLPPEERPAAGQAANETRAAIEAVLEKRSSLVAAQERTRRLVDERIDITLPGIRRSMGARHPLTKAIDEICGIFMGLGYSIAEGPEVELDRYNFEMLNTPAGHPARDTQDTFYITDTILLRTQTSPVQVRVMESTKPPIRIVCPGRVYRSDTIDATHSACFHQIEGLAVDKGITMGDLVGSLQTYARKLFGEETKIRLRPHHFPFTEPSAEVDVTCWACGGKGCRTCKGEGWVEVLGAGMVHPKVLSGCGIDPEIYSGFAFGIGVERTAMARFGIDDLRAMYENDMRFLAQFK
jgi:phenylalanyl-tRNA synthetase alpha chain